MVWQTTLSIVRTIVVASSRTGVIKTYDGFFIGYYVGIGWRYVAVSAESSEQLAL
jgi:hypothetical protein